MIKCENCQYNKERFTRCNKIIGYQVDPKFWYNNEIYALKNIENKDNNCKYYRFSIINFIKLSTKEIYTKLVG